jgi:CRP/FNR family cyclic AMP-dependent transcriptional regulator
LRFVINKTRPIFFSHLEEFDMAKSLDEVLTFTQRVPLFQGLNKKQHEHPGRRFVERKYGAGEAITTQGKGGEGFFIIVSGKANAFRERSDGTKTEVNSFGPKDFFGEIALLDDGLRTASVITSEPTECLVLTRWDFLSAIKEDADMAVVILQEVARRLRLVLDTM